MPSASLKSLRASRSFASLRKSSYPSDLELSTLTAARKSPGSFPRIVSSQVHSSLSDGHRSRVRVAAQIDHQEWKRAEDPAVDRKPNRKREVSRKQQLETRQRQPPRHIVLLYPGRVVGIFDPVLRRADKGRLYTKQRFEHR